MHTNLRRALALSSIVVTLAACGSDSDTSSSASSAAPTTAAPAVTEAPASSAAAPVATDATVPTATVTDAWARTSPMNSQAGAVYLAITAGIDDELVGASVPPSVAGTVELHETVMAAAGGMGTDTTAAGGMTADTSMAGATVPAQPSMEMRPVESIALPAGTSVELKPGGYHIMLLDLAAPLQVGSEISLTLTFANTPPITVLVPVRDDMP